MKRNILSLLMAAAVLMSSACTSSDTGDSSSAPEATDAVQNTTSAAESVPETEPAAVVTEEAAATAEAIVTEETNDGILPAPESSLREQTKGVEMLCAVAYIGFVDPEMTEEECAQVFLNSRYCGEYPEISEITADNCVTECGGYELYLVCPADEAATVSVNEWLLTEENEYMGEAGQVYYRSETGEPVLIRCNVSDIMPNVVVNIVDSEGRTVQWCPSLSLKDGSVSRYGVEDKVYDITHYIYNETYECYMIEGEAQ